MGLTKNLLQRTVCRLMGRTESAGEQHKIQSSGEPPPPTSRGKYAALLGCLVLLHLALDLHWNFQDLSLRSWDASPHLSAMIYATEVIQRRGVQGVLDLARPAQPGWWPSTGYLPAALMNLWFGGDLFRCRLIFLGYMTLLLISVYHVGRQLHCRRAGLLAAALVSFQPVVYGEGRNIGLDLPGAAMLSLCVALLLATRRFSRLGWASCLGVALGWGVLVRPQVLLYFTPVGVTLLVLALRRPGEHPSWRILGGASLTALVAAAISSLWWWGHMGEIVRILSFHQEQGKDLSGNTEPNWLFYFKALPFALWPWMVLALPVSLWGWVCAAKNRPRSSWLVGWIWLLGGLAITLLLSVHFARFLLPICPAFALVVAIGLLNLPWRRTRRLVIAALVSVSALFYAIDTVAFCPVVLLPHDWQAKAAPLGLSWGPPGVDPMILASQRLSRRLQEQHGRGDGLVIKLEDHGLGLTEGYNWTVGPFVQLALPGARVHGQVYTIVHPMEERPFVKIAGTVMPLLAARPGPQQTYYVVFSETTRPDIRDQLTSSMVTPRSAPC